MFRIAVLLGLAANLQAALVEPCQQTQAPSNAKELVVDLVRSLQTGAAAPLVLMAQDYINHNLGAADGKAGFQSFQRLTSTDPSTRVNVVRVFQDGDFVFVHTEYELFGPKVGFDIFRFENGLIVEHWDNLEERPAGPNAAGHYVADGPRMARDLDKTSAIKEFVRNFVDKVVLDRKADLLPAYLDGGRFIQHNPHTTSDGIAGLLAMMAAPLPPGASSRFRIRTVLGEGDFVLVLSEGLMGGNATASYNLFRVENGKIAEQWLVVQQIPWFSEWKNRNGKF